MTYSIVARDPETGELGVAVQSQSFNTGAAVPWARPGAGAVATQFHRRELRPGRRPGARLHDLEGEQPRYRGLVQAFAGQPELPALHQILTE